VKQRLIKNEYFGVKKAIRKKIEASVTVRIQTLFVELVRKAGSGRNGREGRKGQG
jgi:hypothetical protein